MNDFNVKNMDEMITYAAQKLQVPIEKAGDVLSKQVAFDLAWNIFLLVLVISTMTALGFVVYKSILQLKKGENDSWLESILIMATTIFSFVSVILFFCIFDIIKIILQILINPDFYVLEKILTLINTIQ